MGFDYSSLTVNVLSNKFILDKNEVEKKESVNKIIQNIEANYYLFDANGDGKLDWKDGDLVIRYLFGIDQAANLLEDGVIDAMCLRYIKPTIDLNGNKVYDDAKVQEYFKFILNKREE